MEIELDQTKLREHISAGLESRLVPLQSLASSMSGDLWLPLPVDAFRSRWLYELKGMMAVREVDHRGSSVIVGSWFAGKICSATLA